MVHDFSSYERKIFQQFTPVTGVVGNAKEVRDKRKYILYPCDRKVMDECMAMCTVYNIWKKSNTDH